MADAGGAGKEKAAAKPQSVKSNTCEGCGGRAASVNVPGAKYEKGVRGNPVRHESCYGVVRA